MKSVFMGIATLIATVVLASCTQTREFIPVENHYTEAVASLNLEFDTWNVREINVNFDYIDDIIYSATDSASCIEYWDDDCFDAGCLEDMGYPIDTFDPYIRAWIAEEDVDAFMQSLIEYRKAPESVKDAINQHWCILADDSGLHYQWVRRFAY